MTARLAGGILTIDVPWEPLSPGPVGELVQVVDVDPSRPNTWFTPIDLEDPAIIHQDGLRPSEGDPRSHQQVVYAVASSVIERFERFLGRRFRWARDDRLVLIPHAFEGRNAYFDPAKRAVLFGWFRADEKSPGRNLPGQVIFTCLSSDIVAHEVTHALVHRMRRYFSEPTNPDVLAWHEAFSDLVALFHHFVFPEVVAEAVAGSQGDLMNATGLFELAREFGEATGRGQALRTAIVAPPPPLPGASTGPAAPISSTTPLTFAEVTEPHDRGAVFVGAVFDAYVESYRRSIADLLRLATGGTGVLPEGHLHPDLTKRVAAEAVRTADRYLGMVIRAFDYLPVVDVTFGDIVRAIVTADRDLHPDDAVRLRATLIEAFRRRGIFPADAASLAEDSLSWPPPARTLQLDVPESLLLWLVGRGAQELDPIGDVPVVAKATGGADPPAGSPSNDFAVKVQAWATANAAALGFEPDPEHKIALVGRHTTFRTAQDGQPQPEIVVQLAQRRTDLEDQSLPEQTRAPTRAGTTLIVTMSGAVRYVIAKPLPRVDPAAARSVLEREHHRLGAERLRRLRASAEPDERIDLAATWTGEEARSGVFARLHLQEVGR
jgi:hypothetical protein